MARGHEIKIAADTRDFELGIRNGIIDPLDDADRQLDRLGDAAEDAGRDAARGLDRIPDALDDVGDAARDTDRAMALVGDAAEDVGRDGSRGLDRLEDALKDAQRQSERTADSVDDIDVRGRKAFGGVGEAASEVTQEVGQNLGEAVSSVRGNLADLGQVGQDTLGGLAGTLASKGPAGIAGAAAVAAGAVGLGLITAEIEKQNEHVQKLREYFAEAWQEAVEGGKDYIDQATVIDEMQDIIFNPDRADEYKKIQEDANTLSLDRSILLKAAAGDQDALNMVIQRSNDLYGDAKQAVSDLGVVTSAGSQITAEGLRDEATKLQGVNERWKQYGEINTENQRKAQESARVTSDYLLDAISDAKDATRAVDDFGNVLVTLPDGKEIVIDAKTGQATLDVSRFKKDTDGVIDHLNGKDIVLKARADMSGATAQYNKWIRDHDGRSIKIRGRVITPAGAENWG